MLWVAPEAGPDLSLYDTRGKLRVDLVAPAGVGPSMKLEHVEGYSAILGSSDIVAPRIAA
jgi:hypothetical protein